MKTAVATVCAVLATTLSTPLLAADEHAGHGATHAAVPAAAALTDGLVKKVDKSAGRVTLAHGPLANLGMPAMTMPFQVKDAAWLDQVKEGDKIRFLADNVKGNLTVVKFEKVK